MALLNKRLKIDVAGFLQWWGGELAFLMPDRVRKLFGGARPVLILSRAESGVRAALWDRDTENDLGIFPLDADGARAREQLWQQKPEVQNADAASCAPREAATSAARRNESGSKPSRRGRTSRSDGNAPSPRSDSPGKRARGYIREKVRTRGGTPRRAIARASRTVWSAMPLRHGGTGPRRTTFVTSETLSGRGGTP